MGLIRNLLTVGGVVAFARSATGKRLAAKAKTFLDDPATQQRIADVRAKVFRPR